VTLRSAILITLRPRSLPRRRLLQLPPPPSVLAPLMLKSEIQRLITLRPRSPQRKLRVTRLHDQSRRLRREIQRLIIPRLRLLRRRQKLRAARLLARLRRSRRETRKHIILRLRLLLRRQRPLRPRATEVFQRYCNKRVV
jgi:hypothetical protein